MTAAVATPNWPASRGSNFRFNQVPSSIQNGPFEAVSAPRATGNLLIDASKKQPWSLRQGYRQLQKHLRSTWSIDVNNDELTEGTFERCRIFMIPCPKAKFYEQEFDELRKFVRSGGHLLVTLEDGGENAAQTNINYLLEEFGIACNSDAVIRTVFHKYFDPKEAYISNGVLNRAVAAASSRTTNFPLGAGDDEEIGGGNEHHTSRALSFVYAYGATLSVNQTAVSILSTGSVCFPISRPICAFHQVDGGGRVAVIGSTQMFTDGYFEKEENAKVFDMLLRWLNEGFKLHDIDAREPDLVDAHTIPDHIALSGRLKSCLQASDIEQTLPADFTKLFNSSIRSLDLSVWPETIKCYEQLGLKHEPLSLVVPTFELPQPAMQPAVFPPCFRELPPPQLELFDLDDAFSSTETQLAVLTNKCAESSLDLYIRECAELLGINDSLPVDRRSAKDVLECVLMQIVEYKKAQGDTFETRDYARDDSHLDDIYQARLDEADETMFSDIDDYDNL